MPLVQQLCVLLLPESIKTIISAMWEGPDYTNFYNEIGEEEVPFFFSRHQNGQYSAMAVAEFGFPNDAVLPSNESHGNLTSDETPLISQETNTAGTQSKRPAVILPSPKKRPRILSQQTPSLS
ncbi:hypothetical protein IV203_027031 [Nitzschia inconspicua]|uniref:Uncharacterized protein n=1 Tax=Nitzschia inconspicua TaxID=303405 RepID=A0A9K3PY74_9STRA|nr:hypothetical protein IV203_027031 [Nitzschia inconspicua]